MARLGCEDRLALTVTDATGRSKRWGPDEPDGADIPVGLTFEKSIPGGHKTLSSSLLRRVDLDYPDLGTLDEVRLYGPGNEEVWSGRMKSLARAHGSDGFSISPGAVGWADHLRDDETFREIYVDQDKSRWSGPSLQNRLVQNASGVVVNGAEVAPDSTTGEAALVCALSGAWSTFQYAEATYDGRHLPIGSLYYAWKKGASIDHTDVAWHWYAMVTTTDLLVGGDITADLRAAGPDSGTVTATGSRIFAGVRLRYGATPAGADGQEYPLAWTALAVYGTHGLTKRGADTATTGKGFYVSDILRDVVPRAAPKLTVHGVKDTAFVVPHCVYLDPVKAEDVVLDLNKYHLWKWGCRGRDFFYEPWDEAAGTIWEARLSDGLQLRLDDDDGTNIYNGVVVAFTDPAGQRRLVGPPGYACDQTDASLVDASPTNPANAHGYTRFWGKLELSQTTTIAGAIQIGLIWLAEKTLPQRRGEATIVGDVYQRGVGWRPGWAVDAGDFLCVTDHSFTGPRRVTNVRYGRDGKTLNLTLDNTAYKLDAILEQVGVALVGRIT